LTWKLANVSPDISQSAQRQVNDFQLNFFKLLQTTIKTAVFGVYIYIYITYQIYIYSIYKLKIVNIYILYILKKQLSDNLV
jgi:hypothetical protein